MSESADFDFVCEWFKSAAVNAERHGRKDSALLWRDGLQHILAFQRDAERYRWIRDPFGHGAPWLVVKRNNDQATMGGAYLDAAIDAAIAAPARKGKR